VVRSRREKGTMVQTGLRLEAEILDRLRSGKLGLSDEIRDRLQRTFKEDEFDPVVREVRDVVVEVARLIDGDYGRPWHQSPRGHRAFMVALAAVLGEFEPEVSVGASELMEADLEPESIGRVRAQDVRRWHTYPLLEAAAKRRATSRTGALGRAMRAKREDDRS
jgi:hypothetical protein